MATDWMHDYLDAWNSHDPEKVVAFIAEGATYEDLALSQLHKGLDDIKAFVAEATAFSSDYRFDVVSTQQSGDQYATEWEMSGTNDGEAGGMPATNKPYRIRGISVGRVDGSGKIAENRDYWNMADYLVQVGLMPAPE